MTPTLLAPPEISDELVAFDAERAAVGSILVASPDLLIEAMASVPPDAFWVTQHRELVECVYGLYRQNPQATIDTVRIFTSLQETGSSVPRPLVAELIQHAAVGRQTAVQSFEIVARYFQLRHLRDNCMRAAKAAADHRDDPIAARAAALAVIAGSDTGGYGEGIFGRSFDVVGRSAIEELERRAMPGAFTGGLKTGLLDLDDNLTGGGHFPGQVIGVGARTRTGKTILLGQIASFYAEQARTRGMGPAAYYSMEMIGEEIWYRFAAGALRINHGKLLAGELDDDQWIRMENWLAEFPNDRLWVFDRPPFTVESVIAYCEQTIATTGQPPSAVFIDHLGLIKVAALGPRANEFEQTTASIMLLKQIALKYRTRIVVAIQIGRGSENRADPRPTLRDFRNSGEIEQTLDVALLLYRDELHFPDTEDRGLIEIIGAKQRSGPEFAFKAAFLGQFQRIANIARSA